MADSTLIALADAIVTELRNGNFSLPCEIQRSYRPVVELPDLAAARVLVIPKSLTTSAAARSGHFYDCVVDVGVLRKVNPDVPAELDAMMALVEEISDYLRRRTLADYPSAVWVSFENEPVFVPEHLDQQRQFTSVLSLTYRVWR